MIGRAWDRVCASVIGDPVALLRVLAGVVTAIALAGGALWLVTDRYDRTEIARVQASGAARDAVVALMSYNHRSIDRQVDRTRDLLTGPFADEYARFLNTSVVPGAREKQVSVQTTVVESAVVDAGPGEVGLLLFIERQSASRLRVGADSGMSGLRVTLEKHDDTWKVSELTPM